MWLQMSVKVGWIIHVWTLLGNSSLLGPACFPKHWRLEVVSRTDGYPLSALTDEKWQSLEVKAFPNLNCLLCSLNKAVIHLKKLWALTSEKPLTRDKCSVSAIGCSKSPDFWYGSTYLDYIRFLRWHDLLFWPKEARCVEVCAFCRKLRSSNFLEKIILLIKSVLFCLIAADVKLLLALGPWLRIISIFICLYIHTPD